MRAKTHSAPKKNPHPNTGQTRPKHPSGMRAKVFWFFLFTTDAASEGRAGLHAMASGEEENERSEVSKNSSVR